MFLMLLGKLEVFETQVSMKSSDDESVPTLRVKLPQPELFRLALPKVTAREVREVNKKKTFSASFHAPSSIDLVKGNLMEQQIAHKLPM
jgi:hypothetical protein